MPVNLDPLRIQVAQTFEHLLPIPLAVAQAGQEEGVTR